MKKIILVLLSILTLSSATSKVELDAEVAEAIQTFNKEIIGGGKIFKEI